MKQRTLSLLLSAVLASGVLAGCGGTQAPQPQIIPNKTTAPVDQGKVVTLKIGQIPVVDGLPFWVADQKGYYKDQGLDVQLVTFRSANERDAAIMGGQIDGMLADPIASATLYDSGRANNAGVSVRIASIGLGMTKAEGPMGILASPKSGITSINQLKGVPIATSKNSVMHFVLDQVLKDNGFTDKEINLVDMPQIPIRFDALMADQVKAAILPDPLFSLAESKGAKLLLNDADAKQNYSLSVIDFTDQALKTKKDAITKFFIAYNRAVADIKLNPNGFKDVLVDKAKLPAEVKDAYQVIPFPFAQAPNKADLERVFQWLSDKKITKAPVTYDQLVDTSALPK